MTRNFCDLCGESAVEVMPTAKRYGLMAHRGITLTLGDQGRGMDPPQLCAPHLAELVREILAEVKSQIK